MKELFEGMGVRVRMARAGLGYTAQQVGDLVGINRQYVGKIERGEAEGLTLATAYRLADALGLTPAYLLFGEMNYPELPRPLAELVELLEELPAHRMADVVRIARTFYEEERQTRASAGAPYGQMMAEYQVVTDYESVAEMVRSINAQATAILSALRPGQVGRQEIKKDPGLHRR